MNQNTCHKCQTLNHPDDGVCFNCGSVLEVIPLSPENAPRFPASRRPKLGWASRVFSGVWFGVAALVPLLFVGRFMDLGLSSGGFSFFYGAGTPVIIAATGGFSLGAVILDRSRIRSVFAAASIGAVIAVASFILYIAIVSIVGMLMHDSMNRDVPGKLLAIAGMFLLYLLYGSILVGWLVLIAGATAGALLFAFSFSPANIERNEKE